jgi:hypothetical protein
VSGLDQLLASFQVPGLELPAPPPGAIDPWTGTPILADNSTAPPPLAAPIEIPLTPPAPVDTTLELPADSATAALVATEAAATSIGAAAAPTGTPITREEVLALLQDLDATIYLMV